MSSTKADPEKKSKYAEVSTDNEAEKDSDVFCLQKTENRARTSEVLSGEVNLGRAALGIRGHALPRADGRAHVAPALQLTPSVMRACNLHERGLLAFDAPTRAALGLNACQDVNLCTKVCKGCVRAPCRAPRALIVLDAAHRLCASPCLSARLINMPRDDCSCAQGRAERWSIYTLPSSTVLLPPRRSAPRGICSFTLACQVGVMEE